MMRAFHLCTALLANAVLVLGAMASGEKSGATPICLTANDLSIATGQPSLKLMAGGSVQIPIWSLSGGTAGQSVAGLVAGLPGDCAAVKVEIVVINTETPAEPGLEDVYRVHLTQMVEDAPFTTRYYLGTPVRTRLPATRFCTRTIVLESCYETVPNAPLWIRIQREPGDPADTFTRPTGLAAVKVTPLDAPQKPQVVQDTKGYNSWPMMQAIGDKLVCVYSRGQGHTVGEDARAVYSRTSVDGGKTWTAETVVANTPHYGEVPVGKGLDSSGQMLLWIRRVGKEWQHDLYRSTDGVKFVLVATPPLPVKPVQITDIFEVPTVGLMALWFGGSYKEEEGHSWGTLTSRDNGATWHQITIESDLLKAQWPTEPAAVYLGDGKILAIARTELAVNTTERAQFQMVSTDYGATWTRHRTNIGDVTNSTPSLILDAGTGLLSNYYYQRGKGALRRRVVDAGRIFNSPLRWPASEVVAEGSQVKFDAGNVNATAIKGTHYLSFYSGKAPDTAVLVSELPAPSH
ncbi:sialidase family protein [Prosthecobacter sp. SYSU 5D2]|uniref:sialidase family protein n=1 Tax=Prosthecobacter sp. SYSU 5D2 TaxID=3134134 RepID=UPI0031FF23F5